MLLQVNVAETNSHHTGRKRKEMTFLWNILVSRFQWHSQQSITKLSFLKGKAYFLNDILLFKIYNLPFCINTFRTNFLYSCVLVYFPVVTPGVVGSREKMFDCMSVSGY